MSTNFDGGYQIEYDKNQYRLAVKIRYHAGLVSEIKQLPDRQWDARELVWYFPVTKYHAKLLTEFGGKHKLNIQSEVWRIANQTPNIGSVSRDKVSELTGKLYPFQHDAVEFLLQAKRAVLADEMGLGKTITAIAFIAEVKSSRALIVTPASVIYNWQTELNNWLPNKTVAVIKSSAKIPNADVLIVSYDLLRNLYEKLSDRNFDVLVLDECHYISNPKAKRTKVVKMFGSVPHILALSGTPFLNRPIELFSILNLIQPAQFSNYFKFGVRYCAGYRNYFGWDFTGASNIPELQEKIKHYFLRRTKREVLDQLPDMIRQYLEVEIADEFKRQYNNAIRQSKANDENKLSLLASLRQIIGLAKVKSAIELAENILSEKDKIVLFAHHKQVIDQLEHGLARYGVLKIVGETSKEQRQKNVDAFMTDSKYRVMLISLAGGEGINLQIADTIIFVEREWNPGKEGQIESRIHRIGQNSNIVQVIYLICRYTIDEKIHKLIKSKRQVFSELIKLDEIQEIEVID